jgi:hypothetical protein
MSEGLALADICESKSETSEKSLEGSKTIVKASGDFPFFGIYRIFTKTGGLLSLSPLILAEHGEENNDAQTMDRNGTLQAALRGALAGQSL